MKLMHQLARLLGCPVGRARWFISSKVEGAGVAF